MNQTTRRRDRRTLLRDAVAVGVAAAMTVVGALYAQRSGLWLYPRITARRSLAAAPGLSAIDLGGLLLPVAACLLLWWRRVRPVAVAMTLTLLCTLLPVAPAAAIALFTVAAVCDTRATRRVIAVGLLPIPVCLAAQGRLDSSHVAAAVTGTLLVTGSVGWGLFVRGLRERAARAEREQLLSAEEARRREREVIAREMHDVLAHRLSLLSVHAGALVFNPHAPPDQIKQAAEVVAHSARQAMEDLQQVLGVLRTPLTPDGVRTEPPQPTLRDLNSLISENRAAGMEIAMETRLAQAQSLDDFTSRTVYRIVQEALTNARKHAPQEDVRVVLTGSPGSGIRLEVVNALPDPPPLVPPIGAGLGLIGLAERAALAGGQLTYGRGSGSHVVTARLPWST
ncbi:histidine kinase [Streptomyces sp. NBC_01341]|uniref:sensor histidine kinase n=1 Tax=Streptomyces sp. NBC_01341 TaxID=2903831 RepID=UPI002E1220AD|nr:histidine kinase [Streptomyces sp. NBC_01341]